MERDTNMAHNSMKEKIQALDDMQLYTLISNVVRASGMDEKRIAHLTGDIPRLKRMLCSLSDEQINTLLSSLGRGTANDIINRL